MSGMPVVCGAGGLVDGLVPKMRALKSSLFISLLSQACVFFHMFCFVKRLKRALCSRPSQLQDSVFCVQ